jgi:hypothetical protein
VGSTWIGGVTVSDLSILFHCTPARNLPSIWRNGLQPALAKGKLKVVWACERRKRTWALAHVAERHSTPVRQLAVLEIHIPKSDVRRNRDGVWTCARVIRPTELFGCNGLKICLKSVS